MNCRVQARPWSRRFDARVKFMGVPVPATVVLQPAAGPAVTILGMVAGLDARRVEVDAPTARALAAGLVEAADRAEAQPDPRQPTIAGIDEGRGG